MYLTKKNSFEPAKVLRKLAIEMEGNLLAGSVVDKAAVQTKGQQVEEFDFNETMFNHSWGE